MAVTVTYAYPVTGVVPPTAAQMLNANAVTAEVEATADADTTATITHNMALTVAQQAALQPFIRLTPLLTQFYLSTWTAAFPDGNTVTLTKGIGVGSGAMGAQLRVIVERPFSETL